MLGVNTFMHCIHVRCSDSHLLLLAQTRLSHSVLLWLDAIFSFPFHSLVVKRELLAMDWKLAIVDCVSNSLRRPHLHRPVPPSARLQVSKAEEGERSEKELVSLGYSSAVHGLASKRVVVSQSGQCQQQTSEATAAWVKTERHDAEQSSALDPVSVRQELEHTQYESTVQHTGRTSRQEIPACLSFSKHRWSGSYACPWERKGHIFFEYGRRIGSLHDMIPGRMTTAGIGQSAKVPMHIVTMLHTRYKIGVFQPWLQWEHLVEGNHKGWLFMADRAS